jgi:phospho-N-acetylmuramoyl-pentapeptide-transferase
MKFYEQVALTLPMALLALVLSVILTRLLLGRVRQWQLGQQVREDGPASHLVKQGTPSLGGIAILLAVAIATAVVWGRQGARPASGLFLLTFLFALLGLADDLAKMIGKSSRGLPARYRIVLEILFAAGFVLVADRSALVGPVWGCGALRGIPVLGGALAVFTIVGGANAVNFTDGVDGLAATLTAICAATMAVALALVPLHVIGTRLDLVGQADLMWVAAALAGASAGFLWFNSNPAQIFMGDVGSLGIGALLGGIAVAGGLELFFALVGIVFVIEVVTVILQVIYFRRTGGKRLFRMTPIHHAFELRGWTEPQIVARFALVGLLAGGIALAAFLRFS